MEACKILNLTLFVGFGNSAGVRTDVELNLETGGPFEERATDGEKGPASPR